MSINDTCIHDDRCYLSDLVNSPLVRQSHCISSKSDVLFSFYNQFCDRVCCYIENGVGKGQRICVEFYFRVGKMA